MTQSEFIYRLGSRVKDLALTRRSDWLTGLSFRDQPFGKTYLKLSVALLTENGFVVKPDGGQPMWKIWQDEPYLEPNTGLQLEFDMGHVSVWHSDQSFWNAWYQADVANQNSNKISMQLAYFARAVVSE